MALKFQVTAVDNGVSSDLLEVNEDEFKDVKDKAPKGLKGVPHLFTTHQISDSIFVIQVWPADDQKI